MRVQTFLQQSGVRFEVLPHWPTFTAQTTAQSLHMPGDDMAKSVVLNADGEYILAVVQATHKIDMDRAREALGANRVALAAEEEFAPFFPDCELGALPPFGSQFGLRTLVDESLSRDERIVIEGNTHEEAIRLGYADFERLEHPQVAAFSHHM